MTKYSPFKIRLLLSFWILLIVAILLPSLYYHHVLEEEILSEARNSAYRRINTIHWLFLREPGMISIESLDLWCKELGEKLGVRITFVADGGRVIADSEVSFDQLNTLENHASRPEIVEARAQDVGISIRFSGTIQKELIYAAKTIKHSNPFPSGVIRIAIPFAGVKDKVDSFERSFWAIIALAFVATLLLSSALARRLGHPIRDIMRVAEAMGKGDYKQRIHLFPNQEFYLLAESLNRMAGSIEAHIQAITDQKLQLEAILDGMTEGVMFLDAQCRIQSTNRSLNSILSDPSNCIGRRPMEVLLSPELQSACEQVLEGKAHQQLEIRLGDERFYEINAVRLNDLKGIRGAVVVFHDISELKRLEKVRRDFVANVSHELRTPLTSIKGYAETLLSSEGSPNSEDARSFLETILRNADNMSKMVDDLLQLARLETHSAVSSSAPVSLKAALSMAWETCAPMAMEKDIQMESFLPEDDLLVNANSEQLVQVFQNLFDNAIRYSPRGEKITVFSKYDHATVTLGIHDEGPGIPKVHQQRVFERFYRVDKHRATGFGGTGLGLAICRHIIRNHGGKIWVESKPGEGATFFFTLKRSH